MPRSSSRAYWASAPVTAQTPNLASPSRSSMIGASRKLKKKVVTDRRRLGQGVAEKAAALALRLVALLLLAHAGSQADTAAGSSVERL